MKYQHLIPYLKKHFWISQKSDGYYMHSPFLNEMPFKISNNDFKHLKYNNFIEQNELKRWMLINTKKELHS